MSSATVYYTILGVSLVAAVMLLLGKLSSMPNEEDASRSYADQLTYFRDTRVDDLCFARSHYRLATVPCEKVKELLIN